MRARAPHFIVLVSIFSFFCRVNFKVLHIKLGPREISFFDFFSVDSVDFTAVTRLLDHLIPPYSSLLHFDILLEDLFWPSPRIR